MYRYRVVPYEILRGGGGVSTPKILRLLCGVDHHTWSLHALQSAAVSNSDFRRIETLTAAEFVLMFKTHNVKITSYKMLSYRRETALQGAL